MSRAGEGTYSMLAGFVRPRLGGADMLVLLWRAKWLMIAVFLPLLAAGLAGAALLPSKYTAETRLIVAPDRSAMVRAELELLRSPAVAHRALEEIGLARAYPELARDCRGEVCARLAADEIAAHFEAHAEPGSPLITARFTHPQAAMSPEMLQAMVKSYLDYRAEVFAPAEAEAPDARQQRAEAEVASAEAAIRHYLTQHELTDLAAERETLQQLERTARSERLQVQSRLRQARAQLAGYEAQLANIPPELAVRPEEVDDPQAESVSNPLYQQVEASVSLLRADVRALRAQETELSQQIAGFEARLRDLMQLAPDLAQLERRREVAEAALRAVSVETAQARMIAETGQAKGGAVRVFGPVARPVKGASLQVPAAILAFLVAALAGLAAGLAHAVTRRGFPTPGSAQRTLGLPVAAAIPKY
jgi:uncharacterized protein involved in exopolysaccharide biosynthesis